MYGRVLTNQFDSEGEQNTSSRTSRRIRTRGYLAPHDRS
jgi:hypothetical protein